MTRQTSQAPVAQASAIGSELLGHPIAGLRPVQEGPAEHRRSERLQVAEVVMLLVGEAAQW